METLRSLFTFAILIALGVVGFYAADLRYERDAAVICAESERREKSELQAKWDKEQAWVRQYKTWREAWIKQHQAVVPIEAFQEP